jgi:hypothetical protein
MPATRVKKAAKPSAKSAESKAPASEGTREHMRYPFRGRAKAVFLPQTKDGLAEEWEVVTTDISRGGISILHRKQLAQGQQVMLVLSDEQRFVEVCWCCQVWPGLFAAGCQFLREPSETALAHMMAADG